MKTSKTYVSDDGQKFDCPAKCQIHELTCEIAGVLQLEVNRPGVSIGVAGITQTTAPRVFATILSNKGEDIIKILRKIEDKRKRMKK